MADPLLDSLLAALADRPGDLPLRLHVAELLIVAGRHGEAVGVVAAALATAPTDARAQALMQRALTPDAPPAPGPAEAAGAAPPPAPAPGAVDQPAPGRHASPVTDDTDAPGEPPASGVDGFDWSRAESELDGPQPAFVDGADAPEPIVSAFDLERPVVTLADVGGMQPVKERLDAAFLAPMRNPELRRLYGKSLRGGLLLYGPPGVGKTFLARAVAGELGAGFVSIGLADVLSRWLGESEQALHELFQLARRSAPCVVFIDEIDAIGGRRSQQRHSGLRTTVNTLLTELDGVEDVNEGVFVLAATNQPWDVDPALRRPGRLDRTVLVTPPDEPARRAILEVHLRDRPVEGIDLGRIARRTEGFSGADLAHVCETAAERALLDSARTGAVRLIGMADVEAALAEIRPSMGPWLDTARTVVSFGEDDGTYADLRAYLKKVKRW